MAQGTVLPTPILIAWNANGTLSPGAKATFYLAGTSTLTNVYADVGLTTPLTNPNLLADGNGRFPEIFGVPGVSLKIDITDATGVSLPGYPADNVLVVPTSAATVDITGTAGEALPAGSAVYLSDGSGAKTAGSWYKADPANGYSSTTPMVGIVPATIAISTSGTIRQAGLVIGLSGLVVGTSYYIGTAGALSTSVGRFLGVADTTTSLVLGANPKPAPADNTINDFRLSLTTGVPVTTADVTAATTVYCTPYRGNRLSLYDSVGTAYVFTSAEFSLAVPATTATMYDLFAYNNAGVPTLEALAWTNDTTRATAIVLTTTGTYTKSGDLTRRYLGSFRTTAVSGQTEDSAAKRYLWNRDNYRKRPLLRQETTASWTYTTATIRQANGAAANQVEVVIGVAEACVELSVNVVVSNTGTTSYAGIGIGEDSTTAYLATVTGGGTGMAVAGEFYGPRAVMTRIPAVGRHYYAWLEWGTAAGTTTWFGTNGGSANAGTANGLVGWVEG